MCTSLNIKVQNDVDSLNELQMPSKLSVAFWVNTAVLRCRLKDDSADDTHKIWQISACRHRLRGRQDHQLCFYCCAALFLKFNHLIVQEDNDAMLSCGIKL